MITMNTPTRILRTGDPHIDQYTDRVGHVVVVREVDDCGYRYMQVCVRFGDGSQVWVNENEMEAP